MSLSFCLLFLSFCFWIYFVVACFYYSNWHLKYILKYRILAIRLTAVHFVYFIFLFWNVELFYAVVFYTLCQVEMTDFNGDPEAARLNINNWVEKLTKGHIKDLGTQSRDCPPHQGAHQGPMVGTQSRDCSPYQGAHQGRDCSPYQGSHQGPIGHRYSVTRLSTLPRVTSRT